VAVPAQRRALFLLFFVLAVMFAGVAWAAAQASVWAITAAAVVLALWMGSLAVQMVRRRH
jgi:TRAP-type mannitol/chloroaromatic compound transport system permease large subunit